MSSAKEKSFCSIINREAETQLFGTATEASIWILLEYNGPWGRDAFPESDLPETVKAHLNAALEAIPGSRLQLIKQDSPYELPRISLAIAFSRDIDPALYMFEFDECDDITSVDLLDMVKHEVAYQAHRTEGPMVLICTNAKRDPCCAVHGLPVYSQLVEILGTSVWRTTHLAGHRFAATGAVLPQGIIYGRMDDVPISKVAADIVAGRIHLAALRGRSYYSPPAQAAEYFLRSELQMLEANAFQLKGIEAISETEWKVRFGDSEGNREHQVRVARVESGRMAPSSCGKGVESVADYHLLFHHVIQLSEAE